MMTNINPIALAKEIHQEIITLRRDFHRHPELGFDVHRTAGIVAKELQQHDLLVKTGVEKTGVVADLIVPGAKKRIALRADMDALPIQEMNDIPYKSQIPLQAHLCGHDAHTAMLLGAAKILVSLKEKLDVNVRFIFQPNEEALPGGAPAMIQEGVLDDVDEIYALHVWPTLPVGFYGICVGPAMAQPDGFDIIVTGRGGHAAAPHESVDPIVIASQIIQSLQTIVSRNVNPVEQAVVTVTQVHGGSSYNVIPDNCIIKGTVRTYNKEVQQLIQKRIEEIVQVIAQAHGAQGTVLYQEGYPVTYNHEAESRKVEAIASSLVGKQNVSYPGQRAMFGEDFAYYTQRIKGCYIQLGCRNEEQGLTRMLHDPRFNIDEECLVYGTALHVAIACSNFC